MSTLDPMAKKYLALLNQSSAFQPIDPKVAREMFTQAPPAVLSLAVEVEEVPLNKIEDTQIPVGESSKMKLRIYTPLGDGPFPLFLYYHGGGWVVGDIEMVDLSCRMLANQTGCIVISVDYRLAPEHKFPIPLQDSYEALKWVDKNANSINGDAFKIIVGGDSAGGNLANAVSMLSKERKGPKILSQILLYPVTNMTFDSTSYLKYQYGFGLDREKMIWYSEHYIKNESDKTNRFVSPLLADALSNLPPTLIILVENDVLRDDGFMYAERLNKAGVKVRVISERGLIHAYFTNMVIFQERIKNTVTHIKQFLLENIKNQF
ncbi:alpha/beta hydrolase [Alkalihalobacillus sp. 1P02AB]|uniref:alpha/beta hydrolase n=1 Tax=Alkalihalobacillus sp. 1P02AB TaxID=3132260 RepID=UPI0039A4BE41